MTITHSQPAGALPAALLARAANAVAGAVRLFGNLSQFRRLREMSDHELADIGLERADLLDAWARRAEVDPTRYLDMLARSRDSMRGV